MAIIASGEMEDVEWLDESQVDTTGVAVPPVSSLSSLRTGYYRLVRWRSMGIGIENRNVF